jgi:hypothetical protein
MLLLDSSVCGLFKWRQFEPAVILLAVGSLLGAFHCPTVTSRSCWPSGACTPITSQCGDLVQRYGPELQRVLRRHLKPTNDSWRMDSDVRPGERRVALPLSGGGLFRCDNRLSPLGPSRTRPRAGRFFARALSRQNPPLPGSSTPTVTPLIRPRSLELKAEGVRGLPTPSRTIFWNRTTARFPRRINASQHFRSFGHACRTKSRLRGDPYGPQRPGLWKWVGTWHRSVRCDELNFRSSTPRFGLTVK